MTTITSPQKRCLERIHFPFHKLSLREAIERLNTYYPRLKNKSIILNNSVHVIKDLLITPVKSNSKQLYDIQIDLHPRISSPVLLDALLMHFRINEQ